MLRKTMLIGILFLAACRTIAIEAKNAFRDAGVKQESALVALEDVLQNANDMTTDDIISKIDEAGSTLADAIRNHAIFSDYLVNNKWPSNVKDSHGILMTILVDIIDNSQAIKEHPAEFKNLSTDAEFIKEFRFWISRARELYRKVDEYIRQFRTRG